MGQKNFLIGGLGGAAIALASPILADTRAGVDAWTRGNFPAAVQAWQVEASKGDADAMFNLGQAYKLGNGVKQDLAMAEALFGRAAALGHIQASDNYGLLLFQRGQRSQALPFIRAAADRGDPRAQYLLGIGHFNGDIVPKDWVRAYALVSLAQQAGLTLASSTLSQMDEQVPMAQRQQAVELAAELRSEADATRARQMAAAELGATVPSDLGPVAASAASRVVVDSPATAGADYARPLSARSATLGQRVPAAVAAALPARESVKVAPAPAPAPVEAAALTGSWRVQLGAFGQPANADALWNRLKANPALAGKPRLNIKAGTVIKLQAGGFASEAAARAACQSLTAGGQTCIAVKG
ncbi:SPOR domain-containing protein [Novosphingobium ginsenosidimutans]|uniref:Sporulation protein n=1 Tax=Novosphingobium ginsenosidimutans TaxID=1176536 RepID=A0A5B8S3V0_9SPHN|nr:SPOR domain-containing protein [Novosphingobium ginsenosidimutans]QEA16226.1 sporulation protein [Novosphingobium ginsenosidimutans]